MCYQKGAEPLQLECSCVIYRALPLLSAEPVQVNEVQLWSQIGKLSLTTDPPLITTQSPAHHQLATCALEDVITPAKKSPGQRREGQTAVLPPAPADSGPARGTRSLPRRNCRVGTRTAQAESSLVFSAASAAPCAASVSGRSQPAVDKWIPAVQSTSPR